VTLGRTIAALVALAIVAPAAAFAHPAAVDVAVLPLSAHVTGMPYAPTASPAELDELTATLDHDLRARHVALADPAAVVRAVRRAGFDQHDPNRACVEPECARKIGALLGARRVVVGAATREMAMIWSTDAQIVDVASGRALPVLQAGYKGDFTTMRFGLNELAGGLATRLNGRTARR
jgi:hypothetical protein